MPHLIPDPPRFASPAEQQVWARLRDQLLDDDLFIAGQRVTDHDKEHEVDLVVAIDGAGIACLEVKGGEVWHDGDSWLQARAGQPPKRIDPVEQARAACYALREYVESDPAWTRGRLRWDHLVVLPHSAVSADFALPDCPRWKIIDRTQLDALMPLIRNVVLQQTNSLPMLDQTGIAQLQMALSGRGLPQRDVVARALENDATAEIITEQQAVILSAISKLSRVEIRGGAGSGKTFLALEQARRLSRAGQRVALICYSHGLASYFDRITSRWSRREQPAYIGEFHDLGITWGASAGPDESVRTQEAAEFWEHTAPPDGRARRGTPTRPPLRRHRRRRGAGLR